MARSAPARAGRRPSGDPASAPVRPRNDRADIGGPWHPRVPQLLIAAALLIALWLTVLLGLAPVFEIGAWTWRALSIAVSAIGAATLVFAGELAAGRSRGRHRPQPIRMAVIGTLAGALCWTWWFTTSGRARDWLRDPLAGLLQAWGQIDHGAAPLELTGPLEDAVLFVMLLLAAITAVVFAGLGHPLAAGSLVALLLLVPVGATGFPATGAPLLVTGVLLALLAWIGSPAPGAIGLVAAGAAVAVAAGSVAFAPPTRDRIWNQSITLSPISATVPDVTIALAEDLRQHSNARAFTFTRTEGPKRFTLATLADFEGGRWLPQSRLDPAGLTVDRARWAGTLPPLADPAAERRDAGVTITIDGLLSSWLPLSQSATQATDADGAGGFDPSRWRWTASTNTARSENSITRKGDRYTVPDGQQLGEEQVRNLLAFQYFPGTNITVDPGTGRIVNTEGQGESAYTGEPGALPGSELITDRDTASAALAPYLALPDDLPTEISRAAREAAGDADNRLAVSMRLQDWFRDGSFVYDESAPYEPGADPNDPYAVMVALLEQKRGFCVHYASTFAIMARSLGVPARVAVGYAVRAFQNQAETTVRGKDLHAWPEIYIDDQGWVAFEPTPGGAGMRADTLQNVPATPTTDPSTEPSRTAEQPSTRTTPTEQPERGDIGGGTGGGRGGDDGGAGAAVVWAAVPLALLLLLLPAAWRLLRRRRRMRAIARSEHPAQHAWAELTDTVADLRLLGPPDATAVDDVPIRARTSDALIEHLEARGMLSGPSAEAARTVGDAMSAERFGGSADPAASGEAAQTLSRAVRPARTALGPAARRSDRVRAALLPRSLFPRAPGP